MGLFSAIGSVLSSNAGVAGIQAGANFAQAMWQNTQNKKAATRAYNREVALWNMNNEYNTPAMQVQRLKDAGLNPALVYGTGASVATGNSKGAAHAPQAAPAANPRFDLLSALQFGQDMKLKSAQTQQVEANSANMRAQTDVIKAQKDKLQVANDIATYNLEWAKKHGYPVGTQPSLFSRYANDIIDFLNPNNWIRRYNIDIGPGIWRDREHMPPDIRRGYDLRVQKDY